MVSCECIVIKKILVFIVDKYFLKRLRINLIEVYKHAIGLIRTIIAVNDFSWFSTSAIVSEMLSELIIYK